MVAAMLATEVTASRATASINQPDVRGHSPFHLAVQCSRCQEVVQVLLQHGANLKGIPENKSVLELACTSGNVSIVNMLLQAQRDEHSGNVWQ